MQFKKDSGMTLVEVMVGLAMSTTVGVIAAVILSQQKKTAQTLGHEMNIRNIANQLNIAISDPNIIVASAKYGSSNGNDELRDCITYPVRVSNKIKASDLGASVVLKKSSYQLINYGACFPTATDPEKQLAFDLILPRGANSTLYEKKTNKENFNIQENRIAGGESPVYYNLKNGTVCPEVRGAPTAECPIEVRAYFWATCPSKSPYGEATAGGTLDSSGKEFLMYEGGKSQENKGATGQIDLDIGKMTPKSCLTAATIHVRFRIVHRFQETKDKPGSLTNRKLPSVPRDDLFYADTTATSSSSWKMSSFGAVSTSVKLLAQLDRPPMRCPHANFTMTSIKDGKPVCECLYPFRLKAIGGVLDAACVASDERCAENERYVGTNVKGEVCCRPIKCGWREITGAQSAGCKRGEWMRAVKFFDKRNIPKAGKDSRKSACFADNQCVVDKSGGMCKKQVRIKCWRKVYCCSETSSKSPCE